MLVQGSCQRLDHGVFDVPVDDTRPILLDERHGVLFVVGEMAGVEVYG